MKITFLDFIKPILPLLFLVSLYAHGENVKIKIVVNDDKTVIATLVDNETSHEFLSLLPLTLTLTDYNQTEKISDLPKKLTKKGAPPAITPTTGDIAYYAPWGNLAIYYKDFGNSPGLIRLGTVDSGLEFLTGSDSLKVKISRVE